MAFPDTIVGFVPRLNLSSTDAILVKQYQEAMEMGNLELAQSILVQIPNYDQKIVTSEYLNNVADVVLALERYYLQKYSPAIIVSSSQPALQEKTDLWFQVTSG